MREDMFEQRIQNRFVLVDDVEDDRRLTDDVGPFIPVQLEESVVDERDARTDCFDGRRHDGDAEAGDVNGAAEEAKLFALQGHAALQRGRRIERRRPWRPQRCRIFVSHDPGPERS